MAVGRLGALALAVALVGCGGGGGDDDDGSDRADASNGGGGGADAAADGIDAAPSLDAATPDAAGPVSKIVFVTSSTHGGDLNGPDGADGICGDRAGEADLTGTFKAWLSGAQSASARLAHHDGPYVLVDDTKVADDWNDLTDGSLDAPIDLDEDGDTVVSDVWTGTTASGSADGARCDDFEDGTDGASGTCGSTTASNADWTDNIVPLCNTALHLYCIQQ